MGVACSIGDFSLVTYLKDFYKLDIARMVDPLNKNKLLYVQGFVQ